MNISMNDTFYHYEYNYEEYDERNNTETGEYDLQVLDHYYVPLVLVIGFTSNMLLSAVLWSSRYLLQSPEGVYVVSCAIMDIMANIAFTVSHVTAGHYFMTDVLCKVLYYYKCVCFSTCHLYACCLITTLSLNLLCMSSYPGRFLKLKRFMSSRKCSICIVIFLTLLSVVAYSYTLVIVQNFHGHCAFFWANNIFYVMTAVEIVFVMLPTSGVSMICLPIIIWVKCVHPPRRFCVRSPRRRESTNSIETVEENILVIETPVMEEDMFDLEQCDCVIGNQNTSSLECNSQVRCCQEHMRSNSCQTSEEIGSDGIKCPSLGLAMGFTILVIVTWMPVVLMYIWEMVIFFNPSRYNVHGNNRELFSKVVHLNEMGFYCFKACVSMLCWTPLRRELCRHFNVMLSKLRKISNDADTQPLELQSL